jgi:hypothetical protein
VTSFGLLSLVSTNMSMNERSWPHFAQGGQLARHCPNRHQCADDWMWNSLILMSVRSELWRALWLRPSFPASHLVVGKVKALSHSLIVSISRYLIVSFSHRHSGSRFEPRVATSTESFPEQSSSHRPLGNRVCRANETRICRTSTTMLLLV